MDSLFSTADLVQAVVLGVALAMDAMAVTLSNSLCEPDMPASKKLAMPVMFALFQMAMPIAGFFGGTLVAPLIERMPASYRSSSLRSWAGRWFGSGARAS